MKPNLKPIENDHLWQRAYLELRTALADGRYHPGERMRLRDLADELGTSVTPVREAVLQLVNDGALELRSPRDIRVRAISVDEYLEVAAIREHLEGMAIEKFVEIMEPGDLTELRAFEEKHLAALSRRDYRRAISFDRSLVFSIFEKIEMPILLDTLDRLWLIARPTVTLLYSDEGAVRVNLDNKDLLDALAAGDGQAAAEIRRNQIAECAEVIIEMLKEQETDETAVNA
jgi:DNA-binding GntR family transcriptional regulator